MYQSISQNQNYFQNLLTLSLALIFVAIINQVSFAQIVQDEDEIKIDSSIVLLNATIKDKFGVPNLSLEKSQFEVYEDGVKQNISFFSKQNTPFAVVILIDTSGSMERRVSMARSATIKFLDGIRVDDQVAIMNFDSKVSLVRDFSNSRDLRPNIYDLKASGMTVLNDAIYKASEMLDQRLEKRKAIIVLSDGADTRSGRSAGYVLKTALKTNITIYTVDMSSANSNRSQRMQNRGVLKRFSKKTGGQSIDTPGGIEMRNAFDSIVKDLGFQYTIGYYPLNEAKDGKWRKINLKVLNDDPNIRTREGYNAPEK